MDIISFEHSSSDSDKPDKCPDFDALYKKCWTESKRKESHDGKKSSHTDYTETHADFCVHAASGRLRFVSCSTAQLHYSIDFSIAGTGVRVKIGNAKSVRNDKIVGVRLLTRLTG